VYCWPYLGEDQVIIKGLGLLFKNGTQITIGDLIKFSPIAYYVAYSQADPLDLSVPSIRGHGCSDMNCEITLRIRLDSIPPTNWPETPAPDHEVILPLEQSFFSTPWTSQNRRSRPGSPR
jgi:hypothetical protein